MPVPLLSFFTGGGFLDIGFEQAGFDIVWTNEIAPAFAEMHKHGMSARRKSVGSTRGDSAISNRKSITDLRPDEIWKRGLENLSLLSSASSVGLICEPPYRVTSGGWGTKPSPCRVALARP